MYIGFYIAKLDSKTLFEQSAIIFYQQRGVNPSSVTVLLRSLVSIDGEVFVSKIVDILDTSSALHASANAARINDYL